jgi:hypothetical protein
MTLNKALEYFGLSEISSQFTIEVDQVEGEEEFPGWLSVDEGSSHLTLVQEI